MPPVLHLIVGVNGAGKTSFYEDFLAQRTPGAEFVNADYIERSRWPGEVGKHSEEAARLAAKRRDELIAGRESFVTETVFSHRSKLELIERARAAGFVVVLYHVHVSTPALAIERVKTRISEGGHPVPEEKIPGRHARSVQLVREAIGRVHRAYVFDNSRIDSEITHVLTFKSGTLDLVGEHVPEWVLEVYADALAAYQRGA